VGGGVRVKASAAETRRKPSCHVAKVDALM